MISEGLLPVGRSQGPSGTTRAPENVSLTCSTIKSNTRPEEGGEALVGGSPAFLTQDGKWVLEHSLSLQETHRRLGEQLL